MFSLLPVDTGGNSSQFSSGLRSIRSGQPRFFRLLVLLDTSGLLGVVYLLHPQPFYHSLRLHAYDAQCFNSHQSHQLQRLSPSFTFSSYIYSPSLSPSANQPPIPSPDDPTAFWSMMRRVIHFSSAYSIHVICKYRWATCFICIHLTHMPSLLDHDLAHGLGPPSSSFASFFFAPNWIFFYILYLCLSIVPPARQAFTTMQSS